MTDWGAFRAEFPVLGRLAYLNAGTCGPVPRRGVEAAAERMQAEAERGRAKAHFEDLAALAGDLRARLAGLLGCEAEEVALMRSTTSGVNVVLLGLGLRKGDEVLTSDEEHPGVLAPLASTRERLGIAVRRAPFDRIAEEIGERTRLVACSHVSWRRGAVVDSRALAASDVPVLLDGAQGLGAIPLDVRELGCDYYAASGQKWLCGPEGTGCLYVRGNRIDDLAVAAPSYISLSDAARAAELPLKPGAHRYDADAASAALFAWWRASIDLLAEAGWDRVHARAAGLADGFAARLADEGRTVAARGATTLVSWEAEDCEAESRRLGQAGFALRFLPGTRYVRASVGAWNGEEELERLADAVTSG